MGYIQNTLILLLLTLLTASCVSYGDQHLAMRDGGRCPVKSSVADSTRPNNEDRAPASYSESEKSTYESCRELFGE